MKPLSFSLFYFLRDWLVNNVLNIRSEKMHLILALVTLLEESKCVAYRVY